MKSSARARRLGAGTLLCLSAWASAVPASAQRMIDERFAAATDGHVQIMNIAGSVRISGWDRDSIAVTGTVHDTPTQRFATHRSEAGVKIGIWDTTVERAPPSNIEVRVPERSQVWVRTGSAAVFVGAITGGVDVHSVGGAIEIEGAPREAFAESMTGAIVLNVRTAVARAKTVTSTVRIHGVITDATATSVSGRILIEHADIARGSFESVDGELRFIGVIRPSATLSFVTHAGAVEFLLPAAASAQFRVGSYDGALTTEFDVPIRTVASKIKGSEQSFTLGEGRAQINVRTFRGRIVVRRR
jgi:hypothetical protein